MHDLCAAAGIHCLQRGQHSRRAAVMLRKHLWRHCEYFQLHELHRPALILIHKLQISC